VSKELTVYIDFKSPYAYLAIEPTRLLAQELDIVVDWLPFVLDIPSYLGSAKLNQAGEVARQSRSPDQWSKVKYAYYDCRRYANLRGITIRGTVKIWDTNLAALGMLWAKQQGDEILSSYVDGIYAPFWNRELDVEDSLVIERVLADAGAEVSGFSEFCREDGLQKNEMIQRNAFDHGVFGVPTYVLGDEIFFGREQLPRIRWLLQGADGAAPDVAYALMPDDVVETAHERVLDVGISLEHPESYLAIPGILALMEELGLTVHWYALPRTGPGRKMNFEDQSRGARHRRYRMQNRQRDQHRYMPQMLESGDIALGIAALLEQYGVLLREGEVAAAWAGMSSLSGYVGSPVFRIGDETFVGRQHLPLIRARFN
jgi:2-hydroxychromene-2-carboxylate isomerase